MEEFSFIQTLQHLSMADELNLEIDSYKPSSEKTIHTKTYAVFNHCNFTSAVDKALKESVSEDEGYWVSNEDADDIVSLFKMMQEKDKLSGELVDTLQERLDQVKEELEDAEATAEAWESYAKRMDSSKKRKLEVGQCPLKRVKFQE
jgi:hypothetical protein